MSPDDLRAGVQAGILTEAQAASLQALAYSRAGQRLNLRNDDEPFEFFKGFAEIFISMGLAIILSGVAVLSAVLGGLGAVAGLPVVVALVAWGMAEYFTRKRRMNLPSMLLTLGFGAGIWAAAFAFAPQITVPNIGESILWPSVMAALGMLGWYLRFRLPFAMFVLGGFVLLALYAGFATPHAVLTAGMAEIGGFSGYFDLRRSPVFALVTLGFGLGAFALAMWFDLRDPHRQSRYSATAFWLHLLAALALVNTIATSLYSAGDTKGAVLTALALLVITLLALVIDRRSFLSAGIGYIAILLWWVMGDGDNPLSWAVTLLVLGGFVTLTGAGWVQLRSRLMNLLPDFPGKSRLPPYSGL